MISHKLSIAEHMHYYGEFVNNNVITSYADYMKQKYNIIVSYDNSSCHFNFNTEKEYTWYLLQNST